MVANWQSSLTSRSRSWAAPGDDGSVEAALRGGLPSRRSPPEHRRRSGPAERHSPDIVLRTRRHHLRPERLAGATGIAEHNDYAKTFIASASRKKP